MAGTDGGAGGVHAAGVLSLWADQLEPGMRLATGTRTIAEADVEGFAALTGDGHPQHMDAAWAASSIFGERVAHGLLVLSCAAGLFRFDPSRIVALRRLRDVTFKRPARLGASIRVEARVAKVAQIPRELAIVTLAWRIVDAADDSTLARARVDVIWRTAPSSLTR